MGSTRRLIAAVVVVGASLLAGCAGTLSMRSPLPASLIEQAEIPDLQGVRYWADEVPLDLVTELRTRFPGIPSVGRNAQRVGGRQVLDILAISGGGSNGAFGAGVLSGWSQSGRRPEFEVVTGVSAGALIAPFAYLGPEYDPELNRIWTAYETSDLIRTAGLPGLLGGDGLVDTEPLANMIARYVNREMLDKIAAQYRRGRLLLVLTTNLDAQRPVVWNMGAIAQSRTPAAETLFRQVLLASSAIPGVFPPVRIRVRADGQIYDELHVDGGTTKQLFVAPARAPLSDYNRLHDRPPIWKFYIILNGKSAPLYEPVQQRTLQIAGRSIMTLLASQTTAEVYQIWRWVRDGGGAFHYIDIPPTFPYRPVEPFDPAYQKKLFALGISLGKRGDAWASKPPDETPSALREEAVPTRPAQRGGSTELFSAESFFSGFGGQ